MILPSELYMAREELLAAITRYLRAGGSASDPDTCDELEDIAAHIIRTRGDVS